MAEACCQGQWISTEKAGDGVGAGGYGGVREEQHQVTGAQAQLEERSRGSGRSDAQRCTVVVADRR